MLACLRPSRVRTDCARQLGHGSQTTTHLDSWAGPEPELRLILSFPVPRARHCTGYGGGHGTVDGAGQGLGSMGPARLDHMLAV